MCKSCITGVQGKAIKKNSRNKFFHKKSIPQKTIPKIISIGVQREIL